MFVEMISDIPPFSEIEKKIWNRKLFQILSER